ncbi:hypothetical protein MARI_05500 [Marinobacter sp. JH2]|nr:hypothetical protein [Marinobacter sp. JH2]QBM16469.1 hypothetical protein MARI_05500 [Marinobacter sp. JH2]
MTDFKKHDFHSAPERAGPLLEHSQKNMDMIHRVMPESPYVLEVSLGLSRKR